MDTIELRIKEGPTKPDLQWAVAYPDRHTQVRFDAMEDAVDAHIDSMEEQPNGTTFLLTGHLASGIYKGWPFRAMYDVANRTGVLHAREPILQA